MNSKIIAFTLDNRVSGTVVSLNEEVVLRMEEDKSAGSLHIGAEYRIPNRTWAQKLKLNVMATDEEMVRILFNVVIENQPNLRAIYGKDSAGNRTKAFVLPESILEGMKIYHRPPKESDLTSSSVPSCAMYSYPDEKTGDYVYNFRMHHVGADALGGFHILKSVGAIHLGVQLHRAVTSGVMAVGTLAGELLTGKPVFSQGYLESESPSEDAETIMWRAKQVRDMIPYLQNIVPKSVQTYCHLGDAKPNTKHDVYALGAKQKEVMKSPSFVDKMEAFRSQFLKGYGNLTAGIKTEFRNEKDEFQFPDTPKAGDVSEQVRRAVWWEKEEMEPIIDGLKRQMTVGRIGENVIFELIYGLAIAHLNGGKSVATRIPRAINNKQGHAQYGATATVSGGIDLKKSFPENMIGTKKAFVEQKTDAEHKMIPAEAKCDILSPPLVIQSCCNFMPKSMVTPFPIIPIALAYQVGKPIDVTLHFGRWFHETYQVLVDSTVEDKGSGYLHTISINKLFMEPEFGQEIIDAMKTVVEGLKKDLKNGAFRSVEDYFGE